MTEPIVKPDRTWSIVGLGFMIALAFYLIIFQVFFAPKGLRGRLEPPQLSTSAEPRNVGYDWTVRDLKENTVAFEQFRGKAVFLNIWATWCPPCVAELPSIARLAANPRLKEVAFVCIAKEESAGTVSDFLLDKNWPMTFFHATTVPAVIDTDAIPATFVIDPDGRIVVMEVGAAAWDDPSVVELLEKLAKPKPVPVTEVKP